MSNLRFEEPLQRAILSVIIHTWEPPTITSLEIKEKARELFPDFLWNQEFCSNFLHQLDNPSTFNGTFHTWYLRDPDEGKKDMKGLEDEKSIDSQDKEFNEVFDKLFNTLFDELEEALKPVDISEPSVGKVLSKDSLLGELTFGYKFTKKGIKKILLSKGYDISNFKEVFDTCRFSFTGEYSSENQKVYINLPKGTHYSRSGAKEVAIKTMAKPHLYNTIRKYYGNVRLKDIQDDDSELSKLLKAYFTWDLRNNL